jgi:ABC-type uncharacterized transport system auxiliary subunit
MATNNHEAIVIARATAIATVVIRVELSENRNPRVDHSRVFLFEEIVAGSRSVSTLAFTVLTILVH